MPARGAREPDAEKVKTMPGKHGIKSDGKRRVKPVAVFALQLAACFTLGVGTAALKPIPWAYRTAAWGIYPALGLLSAYMATRRGLNNYLAWLAPFMAETLAYMLIWLGYPPSPGSILFCAFCGIVGAAAGVTVNRNKGDANGRRN